MPWHARDGGAWRTITAPSVRVAGAWAPVQEAWVRVAGVWQRFFVAMTAAASPDIVTGNRLGAGVATTGSTTATPTGGTGPYTYSWARVSGDAMIGVSNPAAATVTFRATLTLGESKTANWRCTVTDSGGAVAFTNEVQATLTETT